VCLYIVCKNDRFDNISDRAERETPDMICTVVYDMAGPRVLRNRLRRKRAIDVYSRNGDDDDDNDMHLRDSL